MFFFFQQFFDIGIWSLSFELLDIEVDVEVSGEIYNYNFDFWLIFEIENYGIGIIDECILEWSICYDWCVILGYWVISDLVLQFGNIYIIIDILWYNFFILEFIILDSIFYIFNVFGFNYYFDVYVENNLVIEGFLVINID